MEQLDRGQTAILIYIRIENELHQVNGHVSAG